MQKAEHEKEGITGEDLALNKDIGWFNERFVTSRGPTPSCIRSQQHRYYAQNPGIPGHSCAISRGAVASKVQRSLCLETRPMPRDFFLYIPLIPSNCPMLQSASWDNGLTPRPMSATHNRTQTLAYWYVGFSGSPGEDRLLLES